MFNIFPEWRNWVDRRPIIHGALLNGAHLAVVTACLCKILAAAAAYCAFLYASIACWENIPIKSGTIAAWNTYTNKNHPKQISLDPNFSAIYTENELQIIQSNFDRARDGYGLLFICAILAIMLFLYLAYCFIRAYFFEGMKERRNNPDPVAQVARELLLEKARTQLPSDFPETKLTIARETFIRQRVPGSITTFLGNWLLVLLGKGRVTEFQFVLQHEEFHLRCLDPLVGILSKSLRPILAILGAAAASDFITVNLILRRSPILNILLSITFFVLFFRRLYKADFAFRRHKELLADRFAFLKQPSVDLSLIYAKSEKRRTHPARRERVLFLRGGSSITAWEAFLSAQEMTICCVLLISSRSLDDTMGMVPRLLEYPSFVLALLGVLVLGAEACAWPIPLAARRRFWVHGGVIFLVSIICSQHAQAQWFSILLLSLFGFFLLQIARHGQGDSRAGADERAVIAQSRTLITALEAGSPRLTKVLTVLSTLPSWLILGAAFLALWNVSLISVTFGPFGDPMPDSLERVTEILTASRAIFGVLIYASMVVMACVNIKRPTSFTLKLEWLCYSCFAVYGSLFVAWYSFQGPTYIAKIFRLLAEGGESALLQLQAAQHIPGFVWRNTALMSIILLIPISAFYLWRIKSNNRWRRKEFENGES